MAIKELSEDEQKARDEVAQSVDQNAKILTAINPFFNDPTPTKKQKLMDLLKDKDKNFWKAVSAASPGNPECEDHYLYYESGSETLEPIYFWTLDQIRRLGFTKIEKLTDNFASSVGSGHFSEMGAKSTKMQEEAMKVMQTIGILVKSLVNIIYDLREFEIRLGHYKAANSKDKIEAESGLLALKQIWMDNVDIKRGNGSINAMAAGNLQFVTLRDAFMIAKTVAEVDDMDLNDRVKRILEPRLMEFIKWREVSEKELRKRYDIERNYLKSQVASLRMYTRWVKPYLKAANQMEMMNLKNNFSNPALINAFNTVILQFSILARKDIDPSEESAYKTLPYSFRNIKFNRTYSSCVLIDFYFVGIPQKAGQHYVFGGRAEVKFRAFALNSDELDELKSRLEQSDLNDGLRIAEGMTTESLESLREDIEYFMKDIEEREKEKEEAAESEDTNPFLALIGFGGKKKEEKKPEKPVKKIKPENYAEKELRKFAQTGANSGCYNVYDIYKKAHDMASLIGGMQDEF